MLSILRSYIVYLCKSSCAFQLINK